MIAVCNRLHKSTMTDLDVSNAPKQKTDIKGRYVREEAQFRKWISADGTTPFKAEPGRYHLYAAYGGPWSHRAIIVRMLKGLEEAVTMDILDWPYSVPTWTFDIGGKTTKDTVNGCSNIKEIYLKSDPNYSKKFTLPVLWDKVTGTIVNNESADIIRMFNSEFNEFCRSQEHRKVDLYPTELRKEIDEVSNWVYNDINNGVYKCGFAGTQAAYDEAVTALFEGLDKVESLLSKHRYLVSSKFTEADVKLFATLIRFDKVYHGLFKCNKKRVVDYPNIWAYTRDVYQRPGIAQTCDTEHVRIRYYDVHRGNNPLGIVAIGPELDFNAPHRREEVA